MRTVVKRNGALVDYNLDKIKVAILKAAKSNNTTIPDNTLTEILTSIEDGLSNKVTVEELQDKVEDVLIDKGFKDIAKSYIIYRERHKKIRDFVANKKAFIERYKLSDNTADSTVDDNSNVGNKNIGVINAEIHKEDNILINRGMVMSKLKQLYPDFNQKQYIEDLESHIIYKHDESSFAGAIAPYCCSITMFPFLTGGIKGIGGLSASPRNLDSFCGMYVNLIFATSAMFAGAVATSEFLLYFDYFARKEWGNDYYARHNTIISSPDCNRQKTIKSQIEQYFQQVIYSINQPSAARGLQSAFVNFSYFDKAFFEGMFGEFYFPDNSKPIWESLNWLQKEFMQWFNRERLKCILTFPVESFALVYKDGKFVDEESARFVAAEYARGHSFFTYISDTVDSLSSCCRLKNMITTKEFNFTNGNMGVQTGSKSVITLNLNRITQDWSNMMKRLNSGDWTQERARESYPDLSEYITTILERVFKYQVAYNELLWDMYNSNLLPVYKAGFIDLDKQYLTLGINGLNQAAEFLGIKCNNNKEYKEFCNIIFSTFKNFNAAHNGKHFGHKVTLNTECVPAESLAIKNYNWDKADNYWIPLDTNLYASYIFKPNDPETSVLEKLELHGKDYIGEYLDGGAAAHINLDSHLSEEQYWKLLNFAASVGCQYFTFNIPNAECQDCGFIAKQPFTVCPRCGSKNVALWDRVIGYLTKIKNWSSGRQIEQKTRVYAHNINCNKE